VDEISKIYRLYDDDIYDRIIKEADSIFKKYNDLENGECNPDNKFLYYETSECDSIINIDKAHGGYLCGSDKKWNKSHCIAAYCDEGYILNDERTKCEKSMCDEINLEEIEINNDFETPKVYDIDPKTAYLFYLEGNNESYYFQSNKENMMFYYKDDEKIYFDNNTLLKNVSIVYINYFYNATEKFQVLLAKEKDIDNNTYDTNIEDAKRIQINLKKNKKMAGWKISLIIIGLCIGLIITLIITVILRPPNLASRSFKKEHNSESFRDLK